jgi:hypothetical protein
MRTLLILAAALVLGGTLFAVAAPVPMSAGQDILSASASNPLVESARTVVKVTRRGGMGGRCIVRKRVVRMGGMKRVRKVRVCR